jgi:NhaA family Na+:H+ antiporter
MVLTALRDLLRLEAAGGLLLLAASAVALGVANSPLHALYGALLDTPVEVRVGAFHIAKPLLLWVNDGLMAVFFFLIGLELKREVLQGELSNPRRSALPIIAAVGGMAAPAAIYIAVNWGDPVALKGWAIPSATDIAFTLGVLALLGRRVPPTLKLFVLTLAIVDDMGAILIIAVFYTEGLSLTSLGIAVAVLPALYALNRRGTLSAVPYLALGLVLWVAVLKSGVHATLAGIVLALFLPLRVPEAARREMGTSPLEKLEHDLHPTVAFGILPLFAFMNTGISLAGLTAESLLAPVPLGIALGLFFGNQLGIFGLSWIAVRTGVAHLPKRVGWLELYGAAMLCGIGFTMSLFISSLAFEQGGPAIGVDDRLGILAGTALSAVGGYLVLRLAFARRERRRIAREARRAASAAR